MITRSLHVVVVCGVGGRDERDERATRVSIERADAFVPSRREEESALRVQRLVMVMM